MMKLCPVRLVSATGVLGLMALTGAPAVAQDSAGAAPSTVGFVTYGYSEANGRRIRLRLREAAKQALLPGVVAANREEAAFDGRPLPDPSGDISAARQLLDMAEQQLKGFEIEAAKQNVAAARAQLDPHVGRIQARPQDLRSLQLAVGIAHAERDPEAVLGHLRVFVHRFWSVAPAETPWPPDVREQLESLLRDMSKRTVKISSLVPAQAAIDGLPVGPTPVEVRVPAGRHRIEVTATDALAQQRWIEVPAETGSRIRMQVTPQSPLAGELRAVKVLDEKGEGRILSEARRWGISTVYVAGPSYDGRVRLIRLGPSPAGPVVVDRSVEDLRMGLMQLWKPPTPSADPSIWPWVTVGAGAAAVGGGIAARLIAQSTQDDFQSRRHLLTQAQAFDARDQAESEATAGTVLIGAGLAIVAGGLTWAIWEWVQNDEEEP